MITPSDIADVLKSLIHAEFPGEELYEELTPNNFTRPCNLIEQGSVEGDVDFSCGIIEMRASFTITTFVEADEYHHSHLAELHLRQMRLVKLLLPGFIRVQDRSPKVFGKITMSGNYDYDSIKVTFSYYLDRGDFMKLEQLPTIEQLHINEEVQ